MKCVYIAGPFTGPTQLTVARNTLAAQSVGLRVAACNCMPVIPHVAAFNGTRDEEFWLEGTMELMRRCDAVMLCPGWEHSSGTMGEVAEAERLGIPVFRTIIALENWQCEKR